MPLPFEFIIDGPPVSQQTRRRRRIRMWRQDVRDAANEYWPQGELPSTEAILVIITYFYEDYSLDVDNIPKPILDELKGLVYLDDEQVTDIICRKRNLNSNLRIENPSSLLTDGLSRGNEFLHILIQEAIENEVNYL